MGPAETLTKTNNNKKILTKEINKITSTINKINNTLQMNSISDSVVY